MADVKKDGLVETPVLFFCLRMASVTSCPRFSSYTSLLAYGSGTAVVPGAAVTEVELVDDDRRCRLSSEDDLRRRRPYDLIPSAQSTGLHSSTQNCTFTWNLNKGVLTHNQPRVLISTSQPKSF